MYKRLEQTEIERLDKEYSRELMYNLLLPKLIGDGSALEKMHYPLEPAEVWHDAKELVGDVIQMDYQELQRLTVRLISRYNNIDGLPFAHSDELTATILVCVVYMLWHEYQVADEETRKNVLSYGETSTYFDEEEGAFVDIKEGLIHNRVMQVLGIEPSELFTSVFKQKYYDMHEYDDSSCYLPKKNARKEVEENNTTDSSPIIRQEDTASDTNETLPQDESFEDYAKRISDGIYKNHINQYKDSPAFLYLVIITTIRKYGLSTLNDDTALLKQMQEWGMIPNDKKISSIKGNVSKQKKRNKKDEKGKVINELKGIAWECPSEEDWTKLKNIYPIYHQIEEYITMTPRRKTNRQLAD